MPGNPLNITLPTIGVTPGPEYATAIDLALQTIIVDLEAKVTPDEILINANLDFSSFGDDYSAINLKSTSFRSQSAVLAGGNVNSFYSLNGQAVFRDGSGNDVAITSGGAVAGAAGNITTTGSPVYATSGVEILWSGGDLDYRFKDGSGVNDFANLVFSEAHYRNGANTLKVKTIVTTDYDIIWPATGPADNNLAVFDASGNISFTDTVAGAKTFSGAITLDSTLSVSGMATLSAGATLAANQDVTVSGTGQYRHGERTFTIPLSATRIDSNISAVLAPSIHWFFDGPGSGNFLGIPLPSMEDGVRIVAIEVFYVSGATDRLRFKLMQQENVLPLSSNDNQLWSGTGSTGATADSTVMTLAHTVDADTSYTLFVNSENGSAEAQYFTHAKITIDNA